MIFDHSRQKHPIQVPIEVWPTIPSTYDKVQVVIKAEDGEETFVHFKVDENYRQAIAYLKTWNWQ